MSEDAFWARRRAPPELFDFPITRLAGPYKSSIVRGVMMTNETVAQPFEPDDTPDPGVSPAYPSFYFEHQAREATFEPVSWQVPGLLPLGLTVCAAAPKLGKSFLGQQIEHYLSASQPLFGEVKRDFTTSLVIDMEGNFRRTARRSLMITPGEGDFSCIKYVHADEPSLHDTPAGAPRIAWLEKYLANALEAGCRFGHVRIDTLRAFLGSRPRDANAYEWDYRLSSELDQLAHRWGLSVLAMHHTRKSEQTEDWTDAVSGSQGICGGASGVWLLERTRGSREGLLKVTTRDGEEHELPVWFEAGAWRLQDHWLTGTQVRRRGCPRAVVDVLTSLGPMPLSELVNTLSHPRDTIRRALGRLADDGDVESLDGVWRLVAEPAAPVGPEPAAGPAEAGSEAPTLAPEPASTPIPRETEATTDAGVGVAPAAGGEGSSLVAERRNPALDALGEAIAASTGHPVPNIKRELRTAAPWSVVTEAWTGRHRWINPRSSEFAELDAVVLDRNGSYPAVMGSVAVAPNVLSKGNAARVSELRGLAGVALVEPSAELCAELADTFDQAVGRGADRPPLLGAIQPGSPVLLTAPHWETALKLDHDLPVLESWVGKRSTALFGGFPDWAAKYRTRGREEGGEAYDVAKRRISVAVRMLFPTDESGKGRFWRPDWWAAVVAESNVRQWAMAVKCSAPVLALHHVDEVVVAVPRDAPADFVPSPYKLGVNGEYGRVKIKGRLPVLDWIANGYKAEARVRGGG